MISSLVNGIGPSVDKLSKRKEKEIKTSKIKTRVTYVMTGICTKLDKMNPF